MKLITTYRVEITLKAVWAYVYLKTFNIKSFKNIFFPTLTMVIRCSNFYGQISRSQIANTNPYTPISRLFLVSLF